MEVLSLLFFFALVSSSAFVDGEGGRVFKVKHKFGSESERTLPQWTLHDQSRHGRHLAAIDVPIGGNGKLFGTGLYFTKLSIGSPPKDFLLHVDTGSDILWVNCAKCSPCRLTYTDDDPTLKLYDPTLSSTARLVSCSSDFCTEYRKGRRNSDCSSNKACEYGVGYGDGSKTTGYFVWDIIGLDVVSGNLQSRIGNAGVTFGCGVKQTGKFNLDGLIGFGASSTSLISQLAASGNVRKKFAHCLDGRNGGGVFVIGDVVQPALQTTPLVPNAPHYNVYMKSIQVGNSIQDISKFEAEAGKGTVVDSGTTLAYFPRAILDPLKQMILSSQPNLTTHLVEDFFECFYFDKSIDDSFPSVTFGFENSLQLSVYPRDYLIQRKNEEYCLGWQDSGILKSDLIILGGSSTIGLKDDISGVVNQVAGWNNLSSLPALHHKDISFSPALCHLDFGMVVKLFLLSLFMLYNCL
ncbi:hypothetical protein MKW92_040540 [Papaver armeniacum]|nr:hypothetical protein MKW92_040540 [Papaver armeniacum]